ncbi:hypothetical protein [Aquisphaera insulae]|uniref:hypothetical protein n=1 Tax=Aquisphaera insulae TaxID=2712864 RepID=UPI0013E9B827|nr:hypothetical protein [Aquisphaera insulae]
MEMCDRCSCYKSSAALALPGPIPDAEAMRLLAEMQVVEIQGMRRLHESFYITPRRNLRREGPSGERLARILSAIRIDDSWAYFLGFFNARDGVVVFLSREKSDIEALFPPSEDSIPPRTEADWLHDRGVIERW